jgi:hypothetical protein
LAALVSIDDKQGLTLCDDPVGGFGVLDDQVDDILE